MKPRVNSPRVSTLTAIGRVVTRPGLKETATARGSWRTGRRSLPLLQAAIMSARRLVVASPRPLSFSTSSRPRTHLSVTSRPTMVIGMPDSKTILAASGSQRMLCSARGLETTPPIRTTLALSTSLGSLSRAEATLVRAPTGMRVTPSPAAMAVEMIRSTACLGDGLGSLSPSARTVAWLGVRCPASARKVLSRRGLPMPVATGMSSRPKVFRTFRASLVRTSTLPKTVVTALRSSSGERRARARARASSTSSPMSVSMMTAFGPSASGFSLLGEDDRGMSLKSPPCPSWPGP